MANVATQIEIPLEVFSKVVEAIYDCALDPTHWCEAVRMVSDLLASQRCTLGVHDYANGCNELMFDDDYWRLHEEKYACMNPFVAPLQLMPVGSVVTQTMLEGDDELYVGRYYREWVKPQALRDMIAVKALQTGQRTGLLIANRDQANPRYGDAEVRLLTLLSPHVCRALAISDALNLKTVRSEALEATLNALAAGVYLCDRDCRIVYMNRAAEHQAKASHALRIENNRLAPIDRVARRNMSTAIAEATAEEAETPSSGFTLALPAGENTGLVATILPLDRGERRGLCGPFAATAAIFVQDPIVVPPVPGEAFAKLYHLTGGELRVLLAMAPGLGVKEAAEVLGISETTAKTHLQHIYAKTGTAKQTELMRLFMSSTPPVKAA